MFSKQTFALCSDTKECPKKERCKHGDDCKYTDTFNVAYMCFERKHFNGHENMAKKYYENNGGKKNDD